MVTFREKSVQSFLEIRVTAEQDLQRQCDIAGRFRPAPVQQNVDKLAPHAGVVGPAVLDRVHKTKGLFDLERHQEIMEHRSSQSSKFPGVFRVQWARARMYASRSRAHFVMK